VELATHQDGCSFTRRHGLCANWIGMSDRESAMAQWIKAIDLAALPAQSMRRVEIDGTAILLVNRGDESDIRAFSGDCPHAGAPLDEGALCADRIVCPWHKAAFAIDDGRWLAPPALDGLSTFPVRIDDGAVFVKLETSGPPALPVQADQEDRRRIAVIGGGAAGAAAVATLLQSGFGGTVTMFATESQAPYDRTCLSKFVPAGEMAPEEVPSILPERTANDPRLRIEHREVRHLDVATRIVTIDERAEEPFDAVLIASGSVARRPDIPGANLERVFTLRDIGDAAAILHALESGDHAVILGESFIGLETASALRKRGVDVTVVAPNGVPLERPLGARVGKLFREWHEAHGVVFRQGKAAAFEGKQVVEAVRLENGDTLSAKAVIAGIGGIPRPDF
jgi:apoptosis-inducing factor 3